MKKILTILLVAGATAALAEPQTVCPVMGGKINKAQYTDVEGYRIYVCCKGCIGLIEANPQTFIKKMKTAGVDPEPIPKK